jgi:hypothetical protein
MVEPALSRAKSVFAEHLSIDLLGVSGRTDLPTWVNRVPMSVHATMSYPGFVNWITQQHFDIGIAPLADTAFNRCKSSIKTLDYAAMGLPVLASDREAYRGSPADSVGGTLLPDDPDAWFVALSRLARDGPLRQRLSDGARVAFTAGTLGAQAAKRRAAWLDLVPTRTGADPEIAAAE